MYISRYIDIGTFLFLILVSKSEPKVCWSVSAALTGRTYSRLLDSTEGSSADEWTQVQLTVPTNRSDCELLVTVVINRTSRFNSQLKVVTTFVDKIVQLVPLSFTLWFRRAAGQGKYTFNILMIFNRTPFKSFIQLILCQFLFDERNAEFLSFWRLIHFVYNSVVFYYYCCFFFIGQ